MRRKRITDGIVKTKQLLNGRANERWSNKRKMRTKRKMKMKRTTTDVNQTRYRKECL
jgi:hypothetical protein